MKFKEALKEVMNKILEDPKESEEKEIGDKKEESLPTLTDSLLIIIIMMIMFVFACYIL